ncbi:MAG: HAMP domain-containing protein [Chloroflexi bacterium]|nr:HAMP domain-containing protein [Chloroflexota bacterium]
MILRRLSSRLLLTYVTLIFVGVGGLIFLAGWRITSQIIEQNAHELQLQAQIIANALREPYEKFSERRSYEGRSLDSLLASYAQNVNGRVTLVDDDLNVLFTSDSNLRPHSENDHPEFVAARTGASAFDVRWDEWRNEQRLFVATPANGEHGRVFGYLQLSVPTAPIYATMAGTWLGLSAIGGIVLIVAVFASILLARHIAVPVQHLTATSERIANGHLDERVAPAGPDELTRLGVAFNRMAERVQTMIEQQREFVDNAAHELRSPLTSLRLRIEMLQAHGETDRDLTRRYLGQMAREISYLQRLVDHLLALTEVENGDPAPRRSLDLARLLYELADELEPLVQEAKLTWRMDVPEHLPNESANPEQMTIALRNLFDNAIKYTPAGGTITLAANATEKEIAIRVSDTGIGIPAESLPHIFDRFYRVDRAHSRGHGSTGIGLALVRAIVEVHGGRIAVQSRLNEGSTFTVHLPVSRISQKNKEHG